MSRQFGVPKVRPIAAWALACIALGCLACPRKCTPSSGPAVWYRIPRDGSLLLVGSDGESASSWTSTDGANWTETPNDFTNLGRRDCVNHPDVYWMDAVTIGYGETPTFVAVGARNHLVQPGQPGRID